MRYVIDAQVLGFDGDKVILGPSSSCIIERQNRKFLALLPIEKDSKDCALIEMSGDFTASLAKVSTKMASVVSGIVASRRNVEVVIEIEDAKEIKPDSLKITSMRFTRD